MTAMTEALLVGKEHKHGRRQAGMTLNECSQRSAVLTTKREYAKKHYWYSSMAVLQRSIYSDLEQ